MNNINITFITFLFHLKKEQNIYRQTNGMALKSLLHLSAHLVYFSHAKQQHAIFSCCYVGRVKRYLL